MKLRNKVAVVTGGSLGIGKCLALGLAREGAKIVITARNEERLRKATEEIKSTGQEVLAIRSDVSVISDINQMVIKTLEHFGKIDILVNNAGIYFPGLFLEKSEETFDQVINTNFKGLYFCTQLVAKSMVERQYGKIINIVSNQGRIGVPLFSDYTGSKGAVISLTRNLAAELSPLGINVNAVACGLTQTEGVEAINPTKEFIEGIINMTPLRRIGKPEDYVGIVVFLASDESAFITGQTISVDGGISMP